MIADTIDPYDHATVQAGVRRQIETLDAAAAEGRRSFLDMADTFAAKLDEQPIPRATPITTSAARLTRVWADCVICGHELGVCECDPDAYSAALLAKGRVA